MCLVWCYYFYGVLACLLCDVLYDRCGYGLLLSARFVYVCAWYVICVSVMSLCVMMCVYCMRAYSVMCVVCCV